MPVETDKDRHSLETACAKVLTFQRHIEAPLPASVIYSRNGDDSDLLEAAKFLIALSSGLKKTYSRTKDQRYLRAELIAEELAELVGAMANRDELEMLDALCDLAYVVIGTATQFQLPLAAGFEEVHKSNMSKTTNAANHRGDKGKGGCYFPPNLAQFLGESHD